MDTPITQSWQSARIGKSSQPLFGDGSALVKSLAVDAPRTNQKDGIIGEVPPPINHGALLNYKLSNPAHSTCVTTKVESAVGLGLKEDSVKDALDPLCEVSFLLTMKPILLDLVECGTGFIEVVPGKDGRPGALYHAAARNISIHVDDDTGQEYHFIGRDGGPEVMYGRFGAESAKKYKSSIIMLKNPTNVCRYYGFPDWLPAVPRIELSHCVTQHQFDFFDNRGVPEFALFLLGELMPKPDFDLLKAQLTEHVGLGNARKSLVSNIGSDKMTVQLERLAMDDAADPTQFSKTVETASLEIVSAHRVPPALAGIQIPGKMGTANELPNLLIWFQALVIGPLQMLLSECLGQTLGHPELGVPGLTPKSFKWVTITDILAQSLAATKPVDTMSRMRESVPEAGASGRKLEDGLDQS